MLDLFPEFKLTRRRHSPHKRAHDNPCMNQEVGRPEAEFEPDHLLDPKHKPRQGNHAKDLDTLSVSKAVGDTCWSVQPEVSGQDRDRKDEGRADLMSKVAPVLADGVALVGVHDRDDVP